MRIGTILATVAVPIALIVAGCQKQPQQAAPQSAQRVSQAAVPAAPANAQNPAPKPNTVIVFAATSPAPQPAAPAPTATQTTWPPANSRLDLPELDQTFALQRPARAALEAALSRASGKGPVLLSDESATALMDGLSEDFRNSCNAVLATWAPQFAGTGRWTVRVLFSMRRPDRPDETQAVLAFRCAGDAVKQKQYFDEQYFDERPAVVSLTPEAATLKLIPLAPVQDNDSTLFHLDFSQAFTAVGAQLVQLNVSYSIDNPCCDGGDGESGNRLVTLDLATGKPALDVKEHEEDDSHDDEAPGDSQILCDAKVSYVRDAAGSVTSVSTETSCKDNGKPRPEITHQLFRWNADTHLFDKVK